MPRLKLTYFDMNGGRGEPIRLALLIGGIAFEDHRFGFKEFADVRQGTPFSAVPVLTVDDEVISQSNAILRYVGKLAGLYPEDALEALRCDEVLDAVEDIGVKFGATFSMGDAEKKAAREALTAGPLTLFLTSFEKMLIRRGGEHFADGRLTIADLKVFPWLRHLRSGALDHVPTDLADRLAPHLVALCERVGAHPALAGRYAVD